MSKPKTYELKPARGQALLSYQNRLIAAEMPLFETKTIEEVRADGKRAGDAGNLLLQGDCLSACAYLKEKEIAVDLVYIDPPFASGANYAKKILLRGDSELKNVHTNASIGEEIMYADIWQKEDYLNWLYERLL
ncbi:MAG: site-specific DNA-methyltransferase, partial [Gammaproteobacteria bacterium]